MNKPKGLVRWVLDYLNTLAHDTHATKSASWYIPTKRYAHESKRIRKMRAASRRINRK